MATLVVGDMMLSRRAVREGGFFGPDEFADIDAVNQKIDRMRDKIMADPVFKSVIAQGGSSIDFSERYLEAKRRDISFKAGINKSAPDSNSALNDLPVTLTDEQKKAFNDLYTQMELFNHGVERKGYNADMMRQLKNVNDKADSGTLKYSDIAALRYMSAKYYYKREGIFFSPRTDDGKDRLQAAADIFELSSEIADAVTLDYYSPEKTETRERAAREKEDAEKLQQQQAKQNDADQYKQNSIQFINQKNADYMKSLNARDLADEMINVKNGKTLEKRDNIIKYAAGLYVKEYYKDHEAELNAKGLPIELKVKVNMLTTDEAFLHAIGADEGKTPNPKTVAQTILARNEKGEMTINKAMSDFKKAPQKNQHKPIVHGI